MQGCLFDMSQLKKQQGLPHKPFHMQLLKWIGNKQRFGNEIISYFPEEYGKYIEPFLGSGAVLGTLSPNKAIASDVLKPLIDIWITLKNEPQKLKVWYAERWDSFMAVNRQEAYEQIKASYNKQPNAADLLFLSRACYGGVVRFRQNDGYMSTPCGIHQPISPESFSKRVDIWRDRILGADFYHSDFELIMEHAEPGDVVYCDPPYSHSQTILYGAQSFNLERLLKTISECKDRGVYVLLSIDGTKKSGNYLCDLLIPKGLFEREVMVNCGRSMLKRFQMEGEELSNEMVSDRLLLTW